MSIEFDEGLDIWRKAVTNWKQRTGIDVTYFSGMSIDDLKKESESDLERFERNRDGKSPELRQVKAAFIKHISDTQKVLEIFQATASVAAIFPPAMPVGLLLCAAGRALRALGDVHAAYDDIEAFYNKLSRFIDRLSVIEGKFPRDGPFRRAVACIFACQLNVLGIAHKYTKDPKRKRDKTKQWLVALWSGPDSELRKACDEMESAAKDLDRLVDFETFGKAQDILEAHKMDGDNHERFFDRNHEDIESMNSTLEKRDAKVTAFLVQLLENTEKKASSDETKTKTQRSIKSDAKDKVLLARNAIRKAFDDSKQFSEWGVALTQQYTEKHDRTSDFVEGTCSGLISHPHFQRWVGGDIPFLWITAAEGMGKSFMAHATINHLEKLSNMQKASFTWFFFNEDSGVVQSVNNALACIVWQIAKSDTEYCQKVGQELEKSGIIGDNLPIWERLIAKNYPPGGDQRLFLVLDSMDEAPAENVEALGQALSQITKERLRISVLLTSRPSLDPPCGPDSWTRIKITTELLSSDIELLIKARCNSSPRLSKFTKKTQKRILHQIKAKADGMLYAEHMLRRLSYLGRQDLVLQDLEDIPEDLQSLYLLMIIECDSFRSKEQHAALKQLFAWLTYSKRPLTLAEAEDIVRMAAKARAFDIEEEIRGRLGRLLKLHRLYDDDEYDDDEYDDDMIDETDDVLDDFDKDPLENNSHVLVFQERSLREFFRAIGADDNGLRTPSSAAHLEIFLLATSVIIDAKKPDIENSLLNYASQFWSQHFVEIEIEKLSDNDLHMVLVNLHRIFTNTGNIASTFEQYADPERIYPRSSTVNGKLWFDHLQQVIARGASLPDGTLDPVLEHWVREPQSSLERRLALLAKGHVNNWQRSLKARNILHAFSFAVKAMNITISELKNIEEATRQMSIAFQDILEDVGGPRAIATVLWCADYQELHGTAIHLFQISLARMHEDKGLERFSTLRLLALCYKDAGQSTKAVRSIDQAVASLPEGWERDEDLFMSKRDLLVFKAQILRRENKVEEAIQTYQTCREMSTTRLKLHLAGVSLDNLLDLIWDHPTTSLEFMDLIRMFTDEERKAWFDFLVEEEYPASLNHLKEAAKKEGLSGFGYLIECYTNYERSLPLDSYKRLIVQAQKAEAYKDITEDLQKAKELFRCALNRQPRLRDVAKLENMRSRVRRSLAELIFNDFRSSCAPGHKKDLLMEMKRLDTPNEMSFRPRESQTDIMLALMLRTLGPAVEYEEYMNKTFEVCLQGLRDDVGWNDQASFRLLAKVLACVDGLEREALIAIYCQYSMILDISDPENDNSNGVEEHASKGEIKHSVRYASERLVWAHFANEDLTSGRNIVCSGDCGFSQSSWKKPLYYCIICSDCDLCPKCYSDRMAQNSGKETNNHWRRYCGKDHGYIKGPITGWIGVEDGLIKVAGDEDIHVVDWLRDLEKVRWKEAWKSFWRRQDEVRDIGFSSSQQQPENDD